MYQETPVQPTYEPTPKKTNIGLMIGIVAAIILCCCCIIVIGGYAFYSVTSAVQSTYSSFEIMLTPGAEDFEDFPVIPEIPVFPTAEDGIPEMPVSPSGYDDFIPQGGLGDEVLRTDTWVYVMATSAMSGCVATEASKTTIEVLQEPDSAGIWKEKWTVTCEDGTQKSFDVTFSPSAQGGTTIDVTSSK